MSPPRWGRGRGTGAPRSASAAHHQSSDRIAASTDTPRGAGAARHARRRARATSKPRSRGRGSGGDCGAPMGRGLLRLGARSPAPGSGPAPAPAVSISRSACSMPKGMGGRIFSVLPCRPMRFISNPAAHHRLDHIGHKGGGGGVGVGHELRAKEHAHAAHLGQQGWRRARIRSIMWAGGDGRPATLRPRSRPAPPGRPRPTPDCRRRC
jgi:hypothetical protein